MKATTKTKKGQLAMTIAKGEMNSSNGTVSSTYTVTCAETGHANHFWQG
jgi:hypothetical protein